MPCVKAEALAPDMFNPHGVILPVSLGSSLQKAMQKVGGRRETASRRSDRASSSSGDASACCSGLEDDKSNDSGRSEGRHGRKMHCYRSQLEQDVKKLQKQLQEEINLHVALANAVAYSAAPLLKSPTKLPTKAQELLTNIASLEITVSKLEKELASLNYRLCHERNERLLAESHLGCLPAVSVESRKSAPCCSWEESITSLRDMKFGGRESTQSLQQDLMSDYKENQSVPKSSLLDKNEEDELLGSSSAVNKDKKLEVSFQQFDEADLIMSNCKRSLWQNPNQLSEEMVWCMRNIFLCLSESSKISPKQSSSERSSSPVGHLNDSTLTSFSDSSIMPSILQRPSVQSNSNDEVADQFNNFDPYKVNWRLSWRDVGSYSLAAEVSWMSVGKKQLEYASDALRKFRSLVEQLAKVDPACMTGDEKLAFWINLYNTLIMHAYLAYGVPRNDIKFFSLMQKACYTVGGHSFSAAEIEFVILKMKAPVHRPQLALMLALHKFKITEEHRKYSIDNPEPMTLFALSCGMFSSPAVRIFSAGNVHQELQNSMWDYIRASVGISNKGKLLVPKLLHGFAKGVVEDSLLVDWICHHLSPDQVTAIRDSTSTSFRKQRLIGARSFSIVPFDPRFRYLFLPDDTSSLVSP